MGSDAVDFVTDVMTGGTSAVARNANRELVAKPKRLAEDAASRAEDAQNKLEAEQIAQEQKNEAVLQRDASRRRQKALAAGSQGRKGTILTSPLGLPGGDAGGGKTLLGV